MLLPTYCLALVATGVLDVSIEFHATISQHFHVPARSVAYVRGRGIKDDELPVVFFLASEAQVEPAVILNLRGKGNSWWEISNRFHLDATRFYVPLKVEPGPPYGKAYGHFKGRPKSEWGSIVLGDVEVVEMVNLRFLSVSLGVEPETIIQLRGKHKAFSALHSDLKNQKHKTLGARQGLRDEGKGKAKGAKGSSSGKKGGKGPGKGKKGK